FKPVAYTPRHLAERIRAEQRALEARGSAQGERKTITALFADFTLVLQGGRGVKTILGGRWQKNDRVLRQGTHMALRVAPGVARARHLMCSLLIALHDTKMPSTPRKTRASGHSS